MRISYVTMAFPTGAETFACTDLRMLRSLGADLRVHSMRPATPGAEAMLADRGLSGLPVSTSTAWGTLRGLAWGLTHPLLALRVLGGVVRETWWQPRFLLTSLVLLPRVFDIAEQLVAERPDVVHLFWGHYPAMVGSLARELLPGTTVSMFLGAHDLTYRYGPSARAARAADVVFTHARENIADVLATGADPERISVVHRGIDVGLFTSDAPKRPRHIACAARLCREKHVDDVLRICAGLRGRGIEVTATVMGNGPDRARLEKLRDELGLGEAVGFTGHVPHREVRDALARADVFVLMSREDTERLTNAVKEAMASGCVCVVARSPGLHELITDGETGFIVEPGDIDTAQERIAWSFAHEDAARRMREAAAGRIRRDFDARRAMQAYRMRWLAAAAARRGKSGLAPVTWVPSSLRVGATAKGEGE